MRLVEHVARPGPADGGFDLSAKTVARLLCTFVALGLLSACATKPQMSSQSESRQYRSRAARNYTPPGPASDPWGPYITEASQKHDVPERWIREVMRQESGGKMYSRSGDLITSGAGAMGLMQVMPGTYDELRARYPDLGDDPFDPRNNIMAGTAYVREMYDIYGSPGFLAAYNAGPGRLDDYLTRNRTLPEETRRYVASIGPRIQGHEPNTPSPGAQYAMNSMSFSAPSGTRYASSSRYSAPPSAPIVLAPQPVQMAQAAPSRGPYIALQPQPAEPIRLAPPPVQVASRSGEPFIVLRPQVQVAELAPLPPAPMAPPPAPMFAQLPEPPRPMPFRDVPGRGAMPRNQQQLASAQLVPSRPGFSLVTQAHAEPFVAPRRAGFGAGNWAIQVGAFASEGLAASATRTAQDHARGELGGARGSVTSVRQGGSTLYRARLNGLSRDSASQACERLARSRTNCIVISPDAQS